MGRPRLQRQRRRESGPESRTGLVHQAEKAQTPGEDLRESWEAGRSKQTQQRHRVRAVTVSGSGRRFWRWG